MATAGAMQKPPGMLRLKLAVSGIHAIDMVELDRDAGRHETVSRVFGKGRGPGVIHQAQTGRSCNLPTIRHFRAKAIRI